MRSGRSYLNVIVGDVAKQFPGTSNADVKRGLLGSAAGGDPNVAVVPGVGEATLYESHDEIRANTTTLIKGYMLQLTFESENARARKERVIALAGLAAGRLSAGQP